MRIKKPSKVEEYLNQQYFFSLLVLSSIPISCLIKEKEKRKEKRKKKKEMTKHKKQREREREKKERETERKEKTSLNQSNI